MRLFALLLFWSACLGIAQGKPEAKPAKPPRTHSVTLGPMKRVPFVAADVSKEEKEDEAGTLRVRPLFVDTRQKDWTTGEMHEITERSFVVQRVMHVNDTLPDERGVRWVWQPGPWILVDRVTGRVTALHLPDFDAGVSDVTWYRDFAAYCGVHATAKAAGLSAVVWQIGSRHAAVDRVIGKWPPPERVHPACQQAKWQREPMRVTLQPTGGEKLSLDVVGSSTALVEDGDDDDSG